MWKAVSIAVALSAILITIQAQDRCIVCTSTAIHPECINAESMSPSPCPGAPNNGSCYSRIDSEGNVERGCLNQLNNETAAQCDSETCQICVGNDMPNGRPGCNNQLFPPHRLFCVTCAGGVNSTCAGIVNITSTVCPRFDSEDQCYTARPNGNYERGCMSSTDRCRDGENCRQCSGHGCNFEDFSSGTSIFTDAKVIGFVLLSIIFTMLNK